MLFSLISESESVLVILENAADPSCASTRLPRYIDNDCPAICVSTRNENKTRKVHKSTFAVTGTPRVRSPLDTMSPAAGWLPETIVNSGKRLLIASSSMTTEKREITTLKYRAGFALKANLAKFTT